MKKTDLLIVGGSVGAILSATTARKAYGNIDITIIRDAEKVMVPCGIPYIYGTLHDTDKNVIPDAHILDAGINLVRDKVVSLERGAKVVSTEKGEQYQYKKLILATGSLPIIPTFIPGHDLENIYPVFKSKDYLANLLCKIRDASKVVVVGGGFIGMEFAEQIRNLGKEVRVVELAEACLWQAFDKDLTDEIEGVFEKEGVIIYTKTKVTRFNGETKVESVELDNGQTLEADLVLLGLGVKPNSSLVHNTGIELNAKGAIVVDQYTRTNDPDIFAIGDCAEKKCFFTGKDVPVLLASTAAMEARIAGCNAFHLRLVRANKGTISAFATKIFGHTYAAAGITEARAKEEGFSIMTGNAVTSDHHPITLPGTRSLRVKLIFSKCSGIILGAQIAGGDSACEMINILSLAIQKGMTATELNTFQVATHPLLSASPVNYPINAAAMDALSKNCVHLNQDLVI